MSDVPTANGVKDKPQENGAQPNEDSKSDCAPPKQGSSKTRKNKERKARLKESKKQEKTIAIGPDGFPQKPKKEPPVVLNVAEKMRAEERERKQNEELERMKRSQSDDKRYQKLKREKNLGVSEFIQRATGTKHIANKQIGKERRSVQDQILTKMDASKLFLTMDCYSRRLEEDPNPNAPVMGLYDQGTPDTIIKNILASNILGNAHKIHISRPTPACPKEAIKPDFFMQLFGKMSERVLFLERAKDFTYLQKVRWALRRSPHINDLLEDSQLANRVMPYSFKYTLGNGVYPISGTFALFIASTDCPPDYARMLATCSLYSIVNNIPLDLLDLDKLGEDGKIVNSFVQVRNTMPPEEGEDSLDFLHPLLKAFYAALKLMYDLTMKEFTRYIEKLKSERWKPVMRFAFGLLNPDLRVILKSTYAISSAVIDTKKAMLKDIANSLCSQIATDPSNSALFEVCGLAYESGNAEIVRAVADQLPRKIVLNTQISLKNVADLTLVLDATSNIKLHIVGSSSKKETFADECLDSLIEMLAHRKLNHQVDEFQMWDDPFFEVVNLLPFLSNMQKLSIINCDLSDDDINSISLALLKRETPIELLELNENKLTIYAAERLASCLHKIISLKLTHCGLRADHLKLLCEATQNFKGHKMKQFIVDDNHFGDDGATVIAERLINVKLTSVVRCYITPVGEKIFSDNNKPLTKPKCMTPNCDICKAAREEWLNCSVCQAGVKKSAATLELQKHWSGIGANEVESEKRGNGESAKEVESEKRGNGESAKEVEPEKRENGESAKDVESEKRENDKSAKDVESEKRENGKSAKDVESKKRGNGESAKEVESEKRGNGDSAKDVKPEKRENGESAKDVESEKRENGESAKDVESEKRGNGESAKDMEPEKRENGESAKDVESEKRENGESAKDVDTK